MSESSKAFYTIQEAIEWIAFRKESAEVTAEYATNHRAELDKALTTLTQAILMHKVRILGELSNKSNLTYMDRIVYECSEPIQEITTLTEPLDIFPEQNSLETDDYAYHNIQILADILKQQFPPFTTRIPEEFKGYITPYMEIMLETIHEEKLSIDNQSKKDVLADIIAKKMAKRGLKESSNLAGAMATLIRMPESQNGRPRKG
ncbi:MAG: hypothetical protein NC311_01395 [Muribaculaceae bacterium]|nr:hypothetical protein [Muribaculaceae bacterium]